MPDRCLVGGIMKRFFDRETVDEYIEKCMHREFLEELSLELFVAKYE